MFKGRRVGTLTAGIVLIGFGLLFLTRIFLPVWIMDLFFHFGLLYLSLWESKCWYFSQGKRMNL